MAPHIVPLLPKHTVYVEPFAGSAAVMFAKPWPDVSNSDHYREVLNDTNGDVVNFFRQLRDNPDALIRACCLTPYSREEHRLASSDSADDAERARRFLVRVSMSFARDLTAGWRTAVFTTNNAATWQNTCAKLYACADRLHSVHIEHDDALAVIDRWDSPQTLFYCDPPYPGADQGHYAGYTQEHFRALVSKLDACEGSFVLSGYEQQDMPPYWDRFEFDAYASASGQGMTGQGRDKTRAATQLELAGRNRVEVVWRVVRGKDVRPEIRKLYQQGLFDCFV